MATKAKPVAEKKETPKAAVKETKKVAEKTTVKAPAKKKTVTQEQIRQRAYEIFLRTGSHNEHENWVQAEKELLK